MALSARKMAVSFIFTHHGDLHPCLHLFLKSNETQPPKLLSASHSLALALSGSVNCTRQGCTWCAALSTERHPDGDGRERREGGREGGTGRQKAKQWSQLQAKREKINELQQTDKRRNRGMIDFTMARI